jgi:hypothetical protein
MENKYWYSDGTCSNKYNSNKVLHREDGPAIEYADGSKWWYVDGKRHRGDGPACEYADGSKEWYVDGKRHRVDGPAVEWADGSKWWYVDDKLVSEEEFEKHPLRIKYLVNLEIMRLLNGG